MFLQSVKSLCRQPTLASITLPKTQLRNPLVLLIRYEMDPFSDTSGVSRPRVEEERKNLFMAYSQGVQTATVEGQGSGTPPRDSPSSSWHPTLSTTLVQRQVCQRARTRFYVASTVSPVPLCSKVGLNAQGFYHYSFCFVPLMTFFFTAASFQGKTKGFAIQQQSPGFSCGCKSVVRRKKSQSMQVILLISAT